MLTDCLHPENCLVIFCLVIHDGFVTAIFQIGQHTGLIGFYKLADCLHFDQTADFKIMNVN